MVVRTMVKMVDVAVVRIMVKMMFVCDEINI